ncbi:MAG TPA: GNAT family N-acetyltransferase [Mobilitalea sp.]|nr:GNAT family N-acetyltransferase [Mobilitalea sp.]
MEFKNINQENRKQVNDFIITQWYSTNIVVRGEIVDASVLDGFVVYEEDEIIGLITYRFIKQECEIMSLDSLKENQGIGTAMINKVIEIARMNNCDNLKLITTNDNIHAICFYQKRGFDMTHLYHNALDVSRKLKPEIPEVGFHDIPLKHEIEFEMKL